MRGVPIELRRFRPENSSLSCFRTGSLPTISGRFWTLLGLSAGLLPGSSNEHAPGLRLAEPGPPAFRRRVGKRTLPFELVPTQRGHLRPVPPRSGCKREADGHFHYGSTG